MPSINIATFTRVIRIGGDKWHDRLVDKKDSFFFFTRGYDDEKFVNVNRNFEQSFEEMKR